jgi:hypothetical protein
MASDGALDPSLLLGGASWNSTKEQFVPVLYKM